METIHPDPGDIPAASNQPNQRRPRFPVWLLALALGLLTLALYWPATGYDFINCDDPEYVAANLNVQKGLTWDNFQWVFSNPVFSNWHPITMLSYLVDFELYGLKPWGFHLTNILFHACNTVLIFLWLRYLTGTTWRSWMVAAWFGLHPLHVESVAWIAERKDVLSTFFGLLTLWAYTRYAKLCALQTAPHFSRNQVIWYAVGLGCFALGLMSKSMLVTLPCLLLLLDYWPLQRFHLAKGELAKLGPLILEKIPYALLTIIFCVITYKVQQQGGAVMDMEGFPLSVRIENALITYGRYLGNVFWPSKLALFYPHPGEWAIEWVTLSVAVLGIITGLVFKYSARSPWLLVGWLWFVGTLVPVIGLVQVGEQAMADRYMYIPSLGLFIAIAWCCSELFRRCRLGPAWSGIIATGTLLACLATTQLQLRHWRDSETIFRHTLAVTTENEFAHNDYGIAIMGKGRFEEAVTHFREAVRIKPNAAEIHNNLGFAYLNQGDLAEAIRCGQNAIRLKPGYANAHINLGLAYFKHGDLDEAIEQLQETLRLKPDFTEARAWLALAGEIKTKIELCADNPAALNNLAWDLATNPSDTIRNGVLAAKLAEQACALTSHRVTVMVGTLAAAYAEAGRFDEAVTTAQKACALAAEAGDSDLQKRNEELLQLYQAGRPYHRPRE